jgi:hypothetical protein
LHFEPLAAGLWQVPASEADADAVNRGHITNVLIAQDGSRMWAVGSGPTPAFGRALACQVRARWGRPLSDLISPWPRPEAVLGVAGLGPVRHWAHADVAAAMRSNCPACVPRLRARLGAAAADLGAAPVRVPQHLLRGAMGQLGPWHWWRLSRGPQHPVTVWQFKGSGLVFAAGLLWGSGVPDGRDADVAQLLQSTTALLGQPLPPGVRWLGEQGAVLPAPAAQEQARYWHLLTQAVGLGLARGDADTGTPPPIAGLQEQAADPRHALNWQRAWRQAEDSGEGWAQRSLR